jgi:hypothetical protein
MYALTLESTRAGQLADKRALIPFFDHRRSGGIANANVRRIVFSMQHVGVRERNPDLFDVGLAVVTFPSHGEERTMRIDVHNGEALLSYEELNDRVRTVYATWARVCEERSHAVRRTGTDDRTPFGF